MKKLLIPLVFIVAYVAVSCSDDDVLVESHALCFDDQSLQGSSLDNLQNVFEDLQKLNSQYPSLISRGEIPPNRRNYIHYADEAGGFLGGMIGGHIGSNLGGRILGPIGGGIGGLIGHLLGHRYGNEGASALAKKFYGCAIIDVAPPRFNNLLWDNNIYVAHYVQDCIEEVNDVYADTVPMIDGDDRFVGISPQGADIGNIGDLDIVGGCPGIRIPMVFEQQTIECCDSLGYYHNYLMAELVNDENKYITEGKPDGNKIFERIMSVAKEQGFDPYNFSDDVEFQNLMKDIQMIFGQMALTAYKSKTIDEYINMQCLYMTANHNLSEDDIAIYKNFIVEISKKCSDLAPNTIHEYASQLDTLIKDSDVSKQMKLKLALGAQSAINTVLCWQ